MRKYIVIIILVIVILPFVALHFAFVREIQSGGRKISYGPLGSEFEYISSGMHPSGLKTFDYLPGGENTFDIGIGLIRLPLIRYTVYYSAVAGKSDPSMGMEFETHVYMSYFPIKVASYY